MTTKRLATLVGCNYTNTESIPPLIVSINDINAINDLLVSRFAFKPDDIVILTDAQDSTDLPTSANILDALSRMVARAESGDVLFFFFSGHGIRTPFKVNSSISEGACIVPSDMNLVTSVEFRRLVDKLPAGVSFTILAECCHSAGLISKAKEQIGPSATAVAAAAAAATATAIPLSVDVGILLSACELDETSNYLDPAPGGPDVTLGAFTYSILQTLKENPDRVLTNREVVMGTREVLQRKDIGQHPCLYCSDLNAEAPFLQLQQ